ncbi:MAG: hypothetical protein KC636_38940 [Myxococcales bacterium]|nr:hypothetical protein [Myxococcales bacterium]
MKIKAITAAEVVVIDDDGGERTLRLVPGMQLEEKSSTGASQAKKPAATPKGSPPAKKRANKQPSTVAPLTRRRPKPPPRVKKPAPGSSSKAEKPQAAAKKARKKKPAARVKPGGQPRKAPKPSSKSSTAALSWADAEHNGRKAKTAAFKDEGHWVIVPGRKAHLLLFVFEDGTVRDVDAGPEGYLMDVAALYTERGVPGRGSLDALLAELREPDPRTRPTLREIRLTWRKAESDEGPAWMAVVPDLGRMWIRQIGGEQYTVTWEPVTGGSLSLPAASKLAEARKEATRHARKVIGLAGDLVTINDLVWKETRSDGRAICYCTLKQGHFELIELKNKKGAFALYHVPSDTEWTELASGSKNQLRAFAQAFADELDLETREEGAKEAKPEPEAKAKAPAPPSTEAESPGATPTETTATLSDEERDAAMLRGLDELLDKTAAKIGDGARD